MTASRWIAVPLMIVLACVLTTQSSAQQAPPATTVIQINVNLVQVDAVVTDSAGKPVTNLKAEDFELLQDGKPQAITSFEFVDVKTASARRAPAAVQPRNGRPVAPPPPTRALRPDQIRRTIALVVDDLALSFDSITRVRESLQKWVDNEMQPGDLVAVIRTSAGMGSLQQFTSDKRILRKAIELVSFRIGRVGLSSFAPVAGAGPAGSIDTTAFDQELAQRYSVGSMGAIQYVVQGLRDVPGRKSLILFSESMQLTYPDGRSQEVEEHFRRLSDAANRSSVVIYSVDPRGVVYTGLTAEDSLGGAPQQAARVSNDRSNQLLYSREGMETLAQKTGGLFVHDSNDIAGSLRQAVDDGNGYYLLGYQPVESTFEPAVAKFHPIVVRVKRPGLQVRSRTSFFGTPDRGTPPPRTPIAQITHALSAPFVTGDVELRLTALFSNSEKDGSSINAMLYFDAHDLTFSKDPDLFRTAQIDIAAVTFDAEGNQVDGANKTWRFRLDENSYQELLRAGVVYTIRVPIKKAGAYQMRVVLRDSTSQRLGSATQFVEIPDVKKGRLALSGIVMAAEQLRPAAGAELADGPLAGPDSHASPAVRVFTQGMTVVYVYNILNAHADRNKKPQLEVQTRLYRDGQQVHEAAPAALTSNALTDPSHVAGIGRVQLTNVPPGDYVLQVIVTDKLASEKYRIASQSMDFEVRQ